MPNIFYNLPANMPNELTTTLVESSNVRIERIVSTGQASPENFWYDQSENEWIIVLAGAGEVTFEDGRIARLVAGDYLLILANQRHRVSWNDNENPTVWLAVFYK